MVIAVIIIAKYSFSYVEVFEMILLMWAVMFLEWFDKVNNDTFRYLKAVIRTKFACNNSRNTFRSAIPS